MCKWVLLTGYLFVLMILGGTAANHCLLGIAKHIDEERVLEHEIPQSVRKLIQHFYADVDINDHYAYWGQNYYLAFFFLQTVGVLALAIWFYCNALLDHFNNWKKQYKEQKLMEFRTQVLEQIQDLRGRLTHMLQQVQEQRVLRDDREEPEALENIRDDGYVPLHLNL